MSHQRNFYFSSKWLDAERVNTNFIWRCLMSILHTESIQQPIQQLGIRRKNLPALLDISSSTLDGLLNPKSPYYLPGFPKPKRLGKRTVVWYIDDIRAYLANCNAANDAELEQPSN